MSWRCPTLENVRVKNIFQKDSDQQLSTVPKVSAALGHLKTEPLRKGGENCAQIHFLQC